MALNEVIFKELVKRGYSLRGERRVWNISDAKLWFLTPELSQGFIRLKENMPIYRKGILEPELKLLKENAGKIVKSLGDKKFNVIDICTGTGGRAAALIKAIPNEFNLRYGIVTVNPDIIKMARAKVSDVPTEKMSEIKPFLAEVEDLDNILEDMRVGEYQKNVILMLGSRISNYEINEALFNLSTSVSSGDVVILGNGLRKGERLVEINKYKHPLFNEWFVYIMKGLGLKDNEIEFDARFENYRVEILYRMKVDKTIESSGRRVQMKKGDEIVVAVQYKFFESELMDFCKMYFSNVEFIKTPDGEYALIVCRK